jgi:putative SOS response-associated peptidase YedK
MCRRYAFPDSLNVEREFLPAAVWWKFEPHSNIAPGRYVPAIRMHDKATEGVMMRWGLIPNWAEGKYRLNPALANVAKLETSKFFRTPWLEGQRCILPMAGFTVLVDGFERSHRSPTASAEAMLQGLLDA